MKHAPIAIVIALLGAVAGAAFMRTRQGTSPSFNATHPSQTASRAATPAAPKVVGWQFNQDDVACIHNSDVDHLLKIARDGDSASYQDYANSNGCYGISKGTQVYVEDGSVGGEQVVKVRKRGSANSLYTLRRNISPVFAGDPETLIEQAEQDGNVAPLVAQDNDLPPVLQQEEDSMHAAERANVRGTINRQVEACQSHGGDCVTLQPGTKVILDVPSTDKTTAWFEIANPTGDQPHRLVSASSPAVTPD